YGCTKTRPALRCAPYDVARGTYVIGMRKGDAELKAAIDGALAGMRKDGELQKILEKWQLWDDRQVQAEPTDGASRARRTFDADMLIQFAEAALVTLELSVLAF